MATPSATATPSRDAVRIKVIQHNPYDVNSKQCKFCVDPEITSYHVLRNLITRAFDLKGEFHTCYLARDEKVPDSPAVWLPLISDFDLEVAFVKSSEPHLLVKVEESDADNGSWDAMDLTRLALPDIPRHTYPAKLPGLFKEKMEKTLSLVQKALSWTEDGGEEGSGNPPRPPLTDAEFQQMLNGIGQLTQPALLRQRVYEGGLEPSLRKVVWKHLLNVYPEGLTGQERLDYMKQKTLEYFSLRAVWQQHLSEQEVSEEVRYVTNMVRKDVLRTDRHHPYFSGPDDDNSNVQCLYNILTTYALNHPSVGYCQGMSDLASPLLVTMREEAQAYVCFCALMSRLSSNFHIDGSAMTLKFQHLTEALIFYDWDFFSYLQYHQADDLLFCYRWLLLELKREFAFEDALHMLEVLWSSLDPNPPQESLPLFEVAFNPVKKEQQPPPAVTPLQSHYANVCALRRQRSSVSNRSAESLAAIFSRRAASVDCDGVGVKRLSRTLSQPVSACQARVRGGEAGSGVARIREEEGVGGVWSSPEDSPTRTTRKIRNLREFQLLTRARDSDSDTSNPNSPIRLPREKKSEEFNPPPLTSNKLSCGTANARRCFSDSDADVGVPVYCDGGEVDVWQNPVAALSPEADPQLQIICQEERPATFTCQTTPTPSPTDATNGQSTKKDDGESTNVGMTGSVNSCEEVTEGCGTGWQVTVSASQTTPTLPPPPEEFGGGNPFLMFLCLTLLLQHRNHIMQNKMDHNELAMHFDKMVRQHNVTKVLNQARRLFNAYKKLDFSKGRPRSSPTPADQSC